MSFLDGDPDRPVVIGSLNNATHPTPGVLPIQATKSIIRTRTVPHGRGYNELSFEDAQGMERVYLRAERDMDALAKRDQNAVVGRDDRRTVKRDVSLKVGRHHDVHVSGNSRVAVGEDLRSEVGRDAHCHIEGSRFETVGGDQVAVVNGRSHQIHVTEGMQLIDAAMGLVHSQGENSLKMYSPESHPGGPSGVELASAHEIEIASAKTRISLNGHEPGAVVVQTPAASVTVSDERIELRLGGSVIEVRAGFVRINNKTFPA